MVAVVAALTAVPLLVSLALGRWETAAWYAGVIGAILALALPAARLPASSHLQRNEALVISALTFALPPFALALPLTTYGLSYSDAVFEVISGVTTTGLSVVANVESLPFPFHFARAWLQWVGGLGVVVLSVAFLLEPGTATRHLGFEKAEVDDVVGGMRAHARRVLAVYAAVTLAGIALLLATGLSPGDAVLHGLAAISTGGFSSYDQGLGALPAGARAAVSVLCLAGAIPFFLYYSASMRRWRTVLRDAQLRALIIMVLMVAAALFAFQWAANPAAPLRSLEIAALAAISAQSTAGFAVADFAELDNASVGVLIGAMLVGGGLGSTAGGIKLLRLLILLHFLHLLVLRCSVSASAYVSARIGGRKLQDREIESAAAIALAYFGVAFASVIVFLAHDQPALPSIFEVASAVGTVGLSSGLTGPEMPAVLKATLCAGMLMGRVETIALIVLLFPGTWIGRRYRT
ncbi:MAG: hypothetical protein TEF_13470 [Rhizobiales bacterium NRL2]|nr:MAG: hypothetical protein TEF_13470 [Rhizobiales bacterium NRL2]